MPVLTLSFRHVDYLWVVGEVGNSSYVGGSSILEEMAFYQSHVLG
jgi:hypothetical protein